MIVPTTSSTLPLLLPCFLSSTATLEPRQKNLATSKTPRNHVRQRPQGDHARSQCERFPGHHLVLGPEEDSYRHPQEREPEVL